MISWELLVITVLVSAVGAKLYVAWKGKTGQTSTPKPANLVTSEPDLAESTLAYEDVEDVAEDSTKSKAAWDDVYLIAIAMLLCGPLGLILLWRTDKWDSSTKIKLTIVYIGIVLLLAGLGTSSC